MHLSMTACCPAAPGLDLLAMGHLTDQHIRRAAKLHLGMAFEAEVGIPLNQ